MKTVRVWLLIVAAIAIVVPLSAEETNPPEPRWVSTPAVETATVNWAQGVAQQGTANTSAQPAPASSAPLAQQPAAPEAIQNQSQRQKAEEQIKEQEHQRVFGILPSFNVSYRDDAVSLTASQKMRVAFRTAVDPVTFGIAFLVAGYHEADNDLGFGWGIKGYGQRAGAAYLDAFDSTMIGNGILPALLHQDPRYFRLGHGSTTHRMMYAMAAAFICKHDNTGKWEPNYSNVMGNIASGAISNLYYPGSNTGVGLTISNGFIVTAEGTAGAIFQEFWPDISRHFFHKDPTHGRDAQAGTTSNPPAPPQKADKP